MFALHGQHGLSLSSEFVLQRLNFIARCTIYDSLANLGLTDVDILRQVVTAVMQSAPKSSDIVSNLRHLANMTSSSKAKKSSTTKSSTAIQPKSTSRPTNSTIERLKNRVDEIEEKRDEERIAKDERSSEKVKLKEKLRALQSKGVTLILLFLDSRRHLELTSFVFAFEQPILHWSSKRFHLPPRSQLQLYLFSLLPPLSALQTLSQIDSLLKSKISSRSYRKKGRRTVRLRFSSFSPSLCRRCIERDTDRYRSYGIYS